MFIKQILIFMLCLLPVSLFAGVNKCIIDGKTVYTSKKCPENTSKDFELKKESKRKTQKGYWSNTWYEDYNGYKRALNLTKSEKAPIFIYGHTDWCGYCKKFEKNLLADPDVKKYLSKFIKIKLNPEHSKEDNKLFKSWGGTGYPTVWIQKDKNSAPKKTRAVYSKKDKKYFLALLEKKLESFK